MRPVTEEDLALQSLYRWERELGDHVFLVQPLPGGAVREWTWRQTADEVRRMATFLKAQDWEPGTPVAILSRNCAWWILADLAIWMSGHVTVPIYPSMKPQSVRQIMEHSKARACFIGATDFEESVTSGIPPGATCVRFPTSAANGWPTWDVLTAANLPLAGFPVRGANELATIIYTSGTTGAPKGVMHSFANLAYDAKTLVGLIEADRKGTVHLVPAAGSHRGAGRPRRLGTLPRMPGILQRGSRNLSRRSEPRQAHHLPLRAPLAFENPTGSIRQNSARTSRCCCAFPFSIVLLSAGSCAG